MFQRQTLPVPADTPGQTTLFTWFECGPPEAVAKVYLQAALHADELPGTMVLHHLLPLLHAADVAEQLRARFVIVPLATPLGMANFSFRVHLGRYDPNTGVNQNRRWPDLAAAVAGRIGPWLTGDGAANVALIRRSLAEWLAEQRGSNASQDMRLKLITLAHDADIVLDLHCDDDSLMHIFTADDLLPVMTDLADWMGSAATLTAEDSGGGSFDEMFPQLYRKLAALFPDHPIPLATAAATLEYRGTADVSDAVGRDDARRLFGFLVSRGMIDAVAGPRPIAAPLATRLDATQILRVDGPGLLAYRVALGDHVARGQPIADLIALDGPEAFIGRREVVAGTDGIVLSLLSGKYVRRGESIAKIVGTEPIPGRVGYLLED